MARREMEQARRLAQEGALYRYSSALERGDFGIVAATLRQAEEDVVLEQMILEVNEVYQAEMAELPIGVAQPGPALAGTDRQPSRSLFQRWAEARQARKQRMIRMHKRNASSRAWGGERLRNGLIAGSIVLSMVLALVVGWGIYTWGGRTGHETALVSARYWLAPGSRQADSEQALRLPAIAAVEPTTAAAEAYEAPSPSQPAERLIIRNGNLSMVVQDTRATQQSIEGMVAAMAGEGAYVVSSQEYGGEQEAAPYVEMSIRVPAARFDEVMDRLAGLAVRVTSRSESGQDVTEEYVDLEARLESLETARQRLLEIMQQASTTKDLLQAEEQLTQREAEIESLKGRKQYLAQSAALASILVELQPSILSQPVGDGWRPAETTRRAFETLVYGLRGLGDFLIFFAIAVLPWMIVTGLALYAIVRFVLWRIRVRREKRLASGQESPS
jgi:hypothetical protein